MTPLSTSSPSAAPLITVTLALLLANLGWGAGDAVYYRRRPNYYVTSPYQRSPIFTSYQHVPPRIDEPIVAMVKYCSLLILVDILEVTGNFDFLLRSIQTVFLIKQHPVKF